MSRKMKVPFLAAILISASFMAIAEPSETRFVGNWQGQRAEEGKCSFMAWKMARTADGEFKVTFYGDGAKTKVIGTEKGRWEVKGGKLSLLTEGVPAPDIYTYKFIDDNTVMLSNVERDPSADCMADYEFTDYRVAP